MNKTDILAGLIDKNLDDDNRIKLEDVIEINASEFDLYKEAVWGNIKRTFPDGLLMVRKNYITREEGISAGTGIFSGIHGVDATDKEQVFDAIRTVATACKDDEDKEVIIHRMYNNLVMCGVCYTRDIYYGRPYYMVVYNYMDEMSDNDVKAKSRTKWIANNVSREFLDEGFMNLIFAARDLEKAVDIQEFSVEFAIDSNNKVIVYQLKPMDRLIGSHILMTDREFSDTKAFAKCNYLDTHHIMSHQAYWNPSKMIGSEPRPLDYSLFKGILTSGIWGETIKQLGYEGVDMSLMHRVGNKPYVSIDCLFNALIPAGMDRILRDKIFNYYQHVLTDNRRRHRKVDSTIVFGSYNFSTAKRMNKLGNYGFTQEEIDSFSESLLNLTENIINNYEELHDQDIEALTKLMITRRRVRELKPMEETNSLKLYSYIAELIESMRTYCSPGYTRQERCEFIAKGFCTSLVKEGYLKRDDIDAFRLSLDTVSSCFKRDFEDYTSGKLDWNEFDSKYGHLRISICDIRAHSYRKLYSNLETIRDYELSKGKKIAKALDRDVIAKALEESNLNIEVDKLVGFINGASELADSYRFEYGKSIGLLLDIIVRLGELIGIDKEDMSYLEIQDLDSYHSRDSYVMTIEARRNMYHAYSYLVLPDVIINVGDIDVIDIDEEIPDYLTDKCVSGEIAYYDEGHDVDVTGKIVLLSKVTLAYDWIFTKDIKGIITKKDTKDSRIAKRCKELNIPAALGCGEKLFNSVLMMKRIQLDCGNNKISEIK
ncbi:MAG: hypothetical protein E7263_01175 [Lachnospiraceae bacterium]|nr:hypothetical protein [Lachnospiraceae bacterium]